jgi:glutamate--cysteine ligase
MSTLIKTTEEDRPLHPEDLIPFFEKQAKPVSLLKIGVETECFAADPTTQEALPYSGERGIEAILKTLADRFAWKKVQERGRVIALQRGEELVSLEPGGQVELATPVLEHLDALQSVLFNFETELQSIEKEGWVKWLHVGFQPVSREETIEWVPKARYELMRERFSRTGRLAADMMKRMCATQVSLDYVDAEDAMKKLRLGFLASPFVALLTANSPSREGKPWDWVLPRVRVWEETDPVRCGVPEVFLKEDSTLQDYLDYALDVPMIFIVRQKRWIGISKTFRDFLAKGFENYHATMDDFELHLSTLFPDVRLRHYVEIRQMDAVPPERTMALAAFWKGLFYSTDSLNTALELFRKISPADFLKFRLESAQKGFEVPLAGRTACEYTKELLAIAQKGLKSQNEDVNYLDFLVNC